MSKSAFTAARFNTSPAAVTREKLDAAIYWGNGKDFDATRMTLVCGFSFVEAFILPTLATESPAYVAALLGMFSSAPSAVDLGVLPTIWGISGPMFILGPVLFGIATFRAGILPRWAGALLALNIVLVPLGALVPAELQARIIMIPMGIAVAWLGYVLFSERREKASERVTARSAQPEPGQAA